MLTATARVRSAGRAGSRAAGPQGPQLPLLPDVVHDQQHRLTLVEQATELAAGGVRVRDRGAPPAEHEPQVVDSLRDVRSPDPLADRHPEQAAGVPPADLR